MWGGDYEALGFDKLPSIPCSNTLFECCRSCCAFAGLLKTLVRHWCIYVSVRLGGPEETSEQYSARGLGFRL